MLKHAERWLPGYLKAVATRPPLPPPPRHLIFALVDHYEPLSPFGKQPVEKGRERVQRWADEYPRVAERYRDADGRPPCHSFFFPEEEYRAEFLEPLAGFTTSRLGEVEIHLHHDHDTPEGLTEKLTAFRDLLRRDHGLLGSWPDGQPAYAFIHGNWTLCNSHPTGKNCGVNGELPILRDTGCYCDMTMPAGANPAQTSTVNAIYYASDRPGQPFSHDRGVPVRANAQPDAGDLLMIQGPLALNWNWRKWGLLPRFEHADICGSTPPTPLRADLWVRQRLQVLGRPDWIFVKVHTHGCLERNMAVLLEAPIHRLHEHLQRRYNDGENWRLHYVSAREMYNLVKAAEAGKSGSPEPWRDFVIAPPPVAGE